MKIINLIDILWKPCKAAIFQIVCWGNYPRYLRLKAKVIVLAASIGFYENQHLQLIKRIVSVGDSALDVGAHYGIYAKALSRQVSETGHVIALEPLPEVYDVLVSRMKNISQVQCLNCAASDGNITSFELSVPFLAGGVPEPALASCSKDGSIYKTYTVVCTSLDQMELRGKLSFIKIDVEGHEAEVIRGARMLIERHRPTIQVEISESSFETASNIEPFGLPFYEVASLNNGELQRIESVSKEGNYYLRPRDTIE